MGGKLVEFKKKDMHVSLDYELHKRLLEYLNKNKAVGKSELLSRLIDDFLKKNNI